MTGIRVFCFGEWEQEAVPSLDEVVMKVYVSCYYTVIVDRRKGLN